MSINVRRRPGVPRQQPPPPAPVPPPPPGPTTDLRARFGMAVMATEFPSTVEFEEALETAVGSGVYGAYSIVGREPARPGTWTAWAGYAPNDGLRRQLRARQAKDGTTASAYTAVVTVTPWSSQPLPPFMGAQGTLTLKQDGTSVLAIDGAEAIGSYRYATSTSAYPSDATAAAGTLIVGRSPSDVTVAFLDYAERVFITVVPFANALGTGVQGPSIRLTVTRVGGTDIPQGTIAIASTGAASFSFEGPTWAGSYRYAVSTSAFPNDATTASTGTIVNGRVQASIASGVTLTLGQSLYVTIVPFRDTGAAGFQGSAIHLSATRHNFSATKTVQFAAHSLVPFDQYSITHYEFSSGYVRYLGTPDSASPSTPLLLAMPVTIPDGVTITQCSMLAYVASGLGGEISGALQRVNDTGGFTTVAQMNTNLTAGVGWETCNSATISESTTGRRYFFYFSISVYPDNPSNDDDYRIAQYSYTYTMGSAEKAI